MTLESTLAGIMILMTVLGELYPHTVSSSTYKYYTWHLSVSGRLCHLDHVRGNELSKTSGENHRPY